MLALEAEAWDAAQIGNDLGFLAHGIGALQKAAALTKEKIGFLHRVPYFLARLDETAVKEEVMTQGMSSAEEDRHPATLPSGSSELPASRGISAFHWCVVRGCTEFLTV